MPRRAIWTFDGTRDEFLAQLSLIEDYHAVTLADGTIGRIIEPAGQVIVQEVCLYCVEPAVGFDEDNHPSCTGHMHEVFDRHDPFEKDTVDADER